MKEVREARATLRPRAALPPHTAPQARSALQPHVAARAAWLLAALAAWTSAPSPAATAADGIGRAASSPAAASVPAALDSQRFAADLRGCRNAAGGRPAHRSLLAPGHPRIASCLRTRGWWPDGTPSLERLLRRG